MELFDRWVRFGDVGPGRLLHHVRVMHLLIVGCEALGSRLGAPFGEVVAAGGVPHMPVSVRTRFERYPRFGETITVHGAPVDVGETSYTARYELRDDNGDLLAAARTVHVTVDEDGTPQPVSDAIREGVDDGTSAFPAVAIGLRAEDATVGDDPFGHELTVRSTDIEAVGQGYFEEYFREFAAALEAHLDANGASLGARTGPVYPFVPTGLAAEFLGPIHFEDTLAVEGRLEVAAAAGDSVPAGDDGPDVLGHYRIRDNADTRLRCVVGYGCFDGDGERVPFPEGALVGVS